MSPPVRSRGATGPIVGAVAALLLAAASVAGLAPPASAASAARGAAPPSTSRSTGTSSTGTSSTAFLSSTASSSSTASHRASALPTSASTSAPAERPAVSDTPTPTPTPDPPRLDDLPSALVTSFPVVVSGSANPGEVLDVSGGSTDSPDTTCTVTADASGDWSCSLRRLPDGPGVPIRVESRQTRLADSGRVDVLSPPVITTTDGGFTGGGLRGTAYPGATVTVTAENGRTCSFPADSTGAWGCVIPGIGDGRHTVTATQVAPFSGTRSGRSAPVSVVVDTTAPAAPSITAPAPGASVGDGEAIAFAGRGEPGGQVTVYASTSKGTTVACTAAVPASRAWSCRATLAVGSYVASALERDAAGNVSAGSNTIAVTVETRTAVAPPVAPAPTPTPSPAPTRTAPAEPSSPTTPAAPRPGPENWTGTPFTVASAPAVTAASVPGWLRSVALAVAALLLLMLPARLLAAALTRDRSADPGRRAPRPNLFGRNRSRAELGEADALLGPRAVPGDAGTAGAAAGQPVWLAPVVGVVAAALVTLSTSVQDAGAYVRLLLAVAIAVCAVNAVWVLAARGMARHNGITPPRPVVRPVLLIVVAATALGSRLIGLEPALLFGLVLGVMLPEGTDRVVRGRVAAVQVSAVAALGVLAWLTVGVLPSPSGSVSAFAVELANAVALVGIGSTAVALLPVGGLAGRAVFQWSRPIWLGLSLVVYTVLFALLLPVASLATTGAGVFVVAGLALAFAVMCVCVWLWERYVEPAR
ncbi:MAG: Ig-like domain-containing protein [Leifsonia sp.]|uniref:Ig-like domain-containing protein n=1 Tax=Leifsonia sp. TaxID=1870902 RepID=UPI003F816EAE